MLVEYEENHRRCPHGSSKYLIIFNVISIVYQICWRTPQIGLQLFQKLKANNHRKNPANSHPSKKKLTGLELNSQRLGFASYQNWNHFQFCEFSKKNVRTVCLKFGISSSLQKISFTVWLDYVTAKGCWRWLCMAYTSSQLKTKVHKQNKTIIFTLKL